MDSVSSNRLPRVKFLHNQRQALAKAGLSRSEIYSRALSQYGENVVEPVPGLGDGTIGRL